MGTISLQIPVLNQPDTTEDVKIQNDLTILQNVINGNIDPTNLSATTMQTFLQMASAATLAIDFGTTTLVVGNGSSTANSVTVSHRISRTPQVILALQTQASSPSPLVLWSYGATSTTFGLDGQYLSGVASGNQFINVGWLALG